MRKVADEQGIRKYVRFGVEVTGATWDESRKRWTVHTTEGDEYDARVVVAGVGGLHIPNIPELDGAESFTGPVFHSADWNHDVDLRDKKVVVIGTGASAIQFIPIIAQETSHLTVFQRTPPWVLPKKDRPTPEWRKKLFRRVPGAVRALSRPALLGARGAGDRVQRAPRRAAGRRADRQALPEEQDPRPRAARQADPRLPPRLQARTAVEHVLRDVPARRRHAEHRRRPRDRRRRRRRLQRHQARGRHHHLRHRLPRHRRVRLPRRQGPRRARPRHPVPRERRRDVHGHDHPRVPEPVLHARPQHRSRPQLGGVHDRAADEVHRQDARRDGPARRGRGRGRPSRPRTSSTRRSSGSSRRASGRRAAAPAGTSTARARTAPSGPSSRSSTGGRPARSKPTTSLGIRLGKRRHEHHRSGRTRRWASPTARGGLRGGRPGSS